MSHYKDELYHFGIKGQRWGIRRYVNEDGTLTPEGRKRYGTYENFYKAYTEKNGLKNSKQVSLEAKYQQQGMSKTAAEIKAIGKRETEKTIAIVGGVTLGAAITAVAAKKYYDYAADTIIGTDKNPLSRFEFIRPGEKHYESSREHTYSSNRDRGKYDGLWAQQQLKRNATDMQMHPMQYKTGYGNKQDLSKLTPTHLDITLNNGQGGKKASDRTVKNLLGEFRSANPEAYKGLFSGTTSGDHTKMDRHQLDSILANGQNSFHGTGGNPTTQSGKSYALFESFIKSKGYDAITDYNDRLGTMTSKSATIVFSDPSKRTTMATPLSSDEISKLAKIGSKAITHDTMLEYVDDTIASHGKQILAASSAVAGTAGYTIALSNTKTARATKMRNSGASYKEIAKALGVPEDQVGGYIRQK